MTGRGCIVSAIRGPYLHFRSGRAVILRGMSPDTDQPADRDWTQTIQLLRRVMDGDKQALNQLYARYGEKLRTVVRFRLGSRLRKKLESCDVVQEALIASLRHVDQASFTSNGAFFHWLTKLAENRIRDLADHHAAQRRDADRDTPLEVTGPGGDSVFGPIAELATSHQRRRHGTSLTVNPATVPCCQSPPETRDGGMSYQDRSRRTCDGLVFVPA